MSNGTSNGTTRDNGAGIGLCALALVAALTLAGGSAWCATTIYWDGSTDGDMNKNANWNTLADGTGADVAPAGNDAIVSITTGFTGNLPSTFTTLSLASLTFNGSYTGPITINPGSAQTLTLTGTSPLTSTNAAAVNFGANANFSINNAATVTLAGGAGGIVVNGAVDRGGNTRTTNVTGSVTVNNFATNNRTGQVFGGTGTLTLNGSNYTGTGAFTTIQDSLTVVLAGTDTSAQGAGGLTVSNTATLRLDASNQLTDGQGLTLNNSATFNLNGQTESLTTSALTVNGTSTVNWNAGTFTAVRVIFAAGTTSTGTVTTLTLSDNTNDDTTGALRLAGQTLTIGTNLNFTGATASAGDIINNGANTSTVTGGTITTSHTTQDVVVDNASGQLTIASQITSAVALKKVGTGTLVLSGDNTYTGLTTISAGTLKLGAAGTSPNGPLGTTAAGTTVTSGATLDLNGFTLATTEALTIGGVGVGSNGALVNSGVAATWNGTVALTVATTVKNAGDVTLNGVVSGNFALTKDGAGVLTLGGTVANTSTGAVTVSNGTLALNKTASIAAIAGTTIGVSTGATLRLDAADQIADGAAITLTAGTFNIQGNNETITSLTSTGAATVSGTGAGTLTASSATPFSFQNATVTAPLALSSTTTTGVGITFDAANNGTLTLGAINLNSTATVGVTRTFTVGNGSADADLDLTGAISETTSTGLTKTGLGTMRLSGSTSFGGTFSLNAGRVLIADAAGGDRIANATPITISGGATLELGGAATTAVTETLGAITLAPGANTITSTPGGAGGSNVLTLTSVTSTGGSVLFSGAGLAAGGASLNRIAINGRAAGVISFAAAYDGTNSGFAGYDLDASSPSVRVFGPADTALNRIEDCTLNDGTEFVYANTAQGTLSGPRAPGAVFFAGDYPVNLGTFTLTVGGLWQAGGTTGSTISNGAVAATGAGVLNVTTDTALEIAAPVTAGSLFKQGADKLTLTDSGTKSWGVSGALTVAAGNLTFNQTSGTLTVAGAVGGAGNLTIDGGGSVNFSGGSAQVTGVSGTTVLNGSTLQLSGGYSTPYSFGASAATITLDNGKFLLGNSSSTNPLNVQNKWSIGGGGGRIETYRIGNPNEGYTFSGAITLGGNLYLKIVAGSSSGTFSGAVTVTGGDRILTIENTNQNGALSAYSGAIGQDLAGRTLTIRAGNADAGLKVPLFSGNNTVDSIVVEAASLTNAALTTTLPIRFTTFAAIPETSLKIASGAFAGIGFTTAADFNTTLSRITADSTGILGVDATMSNAIDLSGTGINRDLRIGSSTTATYTGTLTPNDGVTYKVGGGGGTLTFSNLNAFTDGAGAGTLNVNTQPNVPAGTVTITNINNYTGKTRLDGGVTLNFNQLAALGTPAAGNEAVEAGGSSTLKYSGTGTLNFNRPIAMFGNVTLDNGSAAGVFSIDVAAGNAITASAGNLTLSNTGGGAGEINDPINLDTGSLTKTGTGRWTLNAANTYSGGTTIQTATTSSGYLISGAQGALGSGAVTLGAPQANPNTTLGFSVNQTVTNTIRLGRSTGSGRSNCFSVATGVTATLTGKITEASEQGQYAKALRLWAGLGQGALELTNATSDYTMGTEVVAGTLLIGNDVNGSGNGPIGNVSANGAATLLGDTAGSNNAAILTSGAFTMARTITVQAGSTGTVTVGGGSDHNSNFTADLTLTRNIQLQSVTTGTNKLTFSGLLNDGTSSFSVTKVGTGTAELTRAAGNTYDGGTTVTAGTLLAMNTSGSATGTGAVTVAGGGTLGGTGTITGTVGVSANGSLAPGVTAGTLATGALTLTAGAGILGSTASFEISTATVYDKVSVTGNVAFGGTLTVTTIGGWTGWADGQVYDLFDWTGTPSGTFDSINLPTLPGSLVWHDYGGGVLFDYTTGQIKVEAGGPAFEVTLVDPPNGPAAGGTSVTISGNGFATSGLVTVDFGGSAATDLEITSTTIVCNTSPHAGGGAVVVTVINPDLSSAAWPDPNRYTYNLGAAPANIVLDPNAGPSSGGQDVTVTGTGFVTGATVTFDLTSTVASNFLSNTTLTCVTPAHAIGLVGVTVTNPYGVTSAPGDYTYFDNWEGDVAPRRIGGGAGGGDNDVSVADWVQIGRFAAKLDTPVSGIEFQKADCAGDEANPPIGDGDVSVADWVKCGRYAAKLDAKLTAQGPTGL